MSTVNIKTDIDKVLKGYQEAIGIKGIKRALRNAINGTASSLRKNTIGIRNSEVWNTKASEAKKDSKVVRVTKDGLNASISLVSKPDNPIKYTTSPTPKTHWKTMKQRPSHKIIILLKKQMGNIKLPGNAVSEPFIATMRAGSKTHTGIFVRIAKMNRIPEGKANWKDTPWKEYPPERLQKIVPVYTIPIAGQVRNDKVIKAIREDLESVFIEEFNKKLEAQLAKVNKK